MLRWVLPATPRALSGLAEGVTKLVGGGGGGWPAAVTAGSRDGWPEGPGRAPPAAAQMFPRGTPLFCGAPRGREEPGAGGGWTPLPRPYQGPG